MWWMDAEKGRKLDEAMKNTSLQLGEGMSEDKYWLEFAKLEAQRAQ
jgi:hypothetical protein